MHQPSAEQLLTTIGSVASIVVNGAVLCAGKVKAVHPKAEKHTAFLGLQASTCFIGTKMLHTKKLLFYCSMTNKQPGYTANGDTG